jgi:outer membrane protein assembly factor BamD (BamD/ComL family)
VARLEPEWFADGADGAPGGSPAELLARGHALLVQGDDPAAAAPLYAAARTHASASPDERCQAHFYEWAARARRDEPGAFALGEEYLARYPAEAGATYVLYFQGLAHARAGRDEAAEAAWKAVLEREGDTPLAECARAALAGR